MQLKLPIYHSEVSVPGWCLIFAILWPVAFFSYVIHSFAIGGDAFNGKVEAGRYFLWKWVRSKDDPTRYLQVSKTCYKANYFHTVAMMIIAVPAFVGIWRIAWTATNQIRREIGKGPAEN